MKKISVLILLNIAAAATVGLMVGLLFKYYVKGDGTGAAEALRSEILAIADSVDACIGVGVVLPDGTSFQVLGGTRADGDADRFPMLSTFKFHQALAAGCCDSAFRRSRGRERAAS